MQTNEKTIFIEKELEGLWPDWQPTEAETRVWLNTLERFDYNTARTAIQQYFSDTGGNYRRPKPSGFITKASVISQGKSVSKEKPELPQTHVFISCIEPPENNPNRTDHKIPVYPDDLKRIDDEDYVRNCAHGMAERFKQLYGGHWIVIVEPRKEPSGLIGEEAREKAFNDILNGPDTKTKLWLKQYLDDKNPVDISEMALQALTN